MRTLISLALSSTLVVAAGLPIDEALANDSAGDPQAPSHLANILERGELHMLCFPKLDGPYVRPRLEVLRERGVPLNELHDPEAYAGIDVDLVRGFAADLGVELVIQPITTSYQDLVKALVEGQGDLIASSLTITDSREELLDFSIPTETVWAVVAVPPDVMIEDLDDLVGTRGAVMRGSSHQELLEKLNLEGIEFVLTDFSLENYERLVDGEADFLVMDSKAEIGQAPEPGLDKAKVVLRLSQTSYAVALPSGSDLKPRLDTYLRSQQRPAD